MPPARSKLSASNPMKLEHDKPQTVPRTKSPHPRQDILTRSGGGKLSKPIKRSHNEKKIDHLPAWHSSSVVLRLQSANAKSSSPTFFNHVASPDHLLFSPVDFPRQCSTSPDRTFQFDAEWPSPGTPVRLVSRQPNDDSITDDASFLSLPTSKVHSYSRFFDPGFNFIDNVNPVSEHITLQPHSPSHAFSATLSAFAEDSSAEEGDDSSPSQACSQRQRARADRCQDGSENLSPSTTASAMLMQETPSCHPPASVLPSFGNSERLGKILPCHSVPKDGLMRITPQTLNDLMDGAFNDRIHDYHVIDCRFDYEFDGGHIPGAVNINTATAVESLLLGPSLTKPKPSVSGDAYRKTVLIFHCEFSMKRAPTFAKHLRAQDRSTNHNVYPKIHYPEVYILDGGYCGYYRVSSMRCQPQSYVTMDDPSYAALRREELHQFRNSRFGRHQSHAPRLPIAASFNRNTLPINNGSTHVFPAGNAARSRRGGSGSGSLVTFNEDHSAMIYDDGYETDTNVGELHV